MHSVMFMAKRVHLTTVAFGQRLVRQIEHMTPARFDLLYVIRRVAILDPKIDATMTGVSQAGLARDLGLHPTTIAKMVKRLLQIGWVHRRQVDGRTKSVCLTELGLQAIARAMELVFGERRVRRVFERIFERPDVVDKMAERVRARVEQRPPRLGTMIERALTVTKRRDIIDVVHSVYETFKRVADYFGDDSSVWYSIGRGLPRTRRAEWISWGNAP